MAVATLLEDGNAAMLVFASRMRVCSSVNAAVSWLRTFSNCAGSTPVAGTFARSSACWADDSKAWQVRARVISFSSGGRVLGSAAMSAGMVLLLLSILWTVPSHEERTEGEREWEAVACPCCSLLCLRSRSSALVGGPLDVGCTPPSDGSELLMGGGPMMDGAAALAGGVSSVSRSEEMDVSSLLVVVVVMLLLAGAVTMRVCEVCRG